MPEKPVASASGVFRFGVFQVNLASRELRKHGVRVRLPGQPFCILSILLQKPGEIVTRDEMRQRLWTDDTFVDFEHSLNSAVKKLRAALGDSPENSRYVETIPRVGYRFIAPVELIVPVVPSAIVPPAMAPTGVTLPAVAVDPASSANPAAAANTARARDTTGPGGWGSAELAGVRSGLITGWLVMGAALAAVLLLITALLWTRLGKPQPAAQRVVLGVLPFENLTGDASQEYFSDGLTEEMIAQLSRLNPQRMGVIALRTSTASYRRSPQDLQQIVHGLGIQYLLSGSVRRDSNQVRIAARLVQTRDQTHVFAREFDRELNSVFAVQGEIANEVTDEIRSTLGDGEKRFSAEALRQASLSPQSYEVYDLYLKGRYFLNKRNAADFQKAADFFQQAVEKNPDYAQAYAGLADTYELLSSWHAVPLGEFSLKARAAALKALKLDDTLAEAHTSLALIEENYDYDWQTSDKEYQRAIELNPNYATAHQWYAESLMWRGRFDEALAEGDRARQLDPLSLIIATDYAVILHYAHQYDRSIELVRNVQKMDPSFEHAQSMIFGSYLDQGRYADALADLQGWPAPRSNPWTSTAQALVYARQGRTREAQRLVQRLRKTYPDFMPPQVLEVWARTGHKEQAIAMLQNYYAQHSNYLLLLKVDSVYDPFRDDPRFQELERRVGLADVKH